jgi:hypothetical protein
MRCVDRDESAIICLNTASAANLAFVSILILLPGSEEFSTPASHHKLEYEIQ